MPPVIYATPEQELEIIRLWNQGNGKQTIALHLKVKLGVVDRCLNKHGLRRTMQESIAVKARYNKQWRARSDNYNKYFKKDDIIY